MPIFGKQTASDLKVVQKLNAELKNSEKAIGSMDEGAQNLAKQVENYAQAWGKSLKYSKKNLDMAKKNSKLGKNVLTVLKAQQKGDKAAVFAAKAKLRLSIMFGKKLDNQSKKLLNQYKSQQKAHKLSKMQNKLEKKRVDLTKAAGAAGDAISDGLGDAGGLIVSAMTNPLTFFISMMKMASEVVDKTGEKFGAIGVQKFADDFGEMRGRFTEMGLSTDDMINSVDKLSTEFGIATDKAMDMAVSVGDLAKSTGISVDESAKLVGYMTEVQGMSTDSAVETLKMAESLSVANGVAPSAVLKDIAANTEVFAKFGASGAKGLMRAAIQARKLGIDLGKVAGAADSLLNFQESLNAEVEASIMLGRDVNLQKARELSLSGDMEGLQKEMLNIIGTEQDFQKMNVLQRQSLARAVGMDVQALEKMVTKQKEGAEVAGEMAEQDISKMIPTEAMSEMTNTMNEMMAMFQDLAAEIGPDLIKMFKTMSGPIMKIVKSVAQFIIKLNDSIGIVNILKGVMAGMFTKMVANLAIQVGLSYAKAAGSLPGPAGLIALAAAPVAVAALVGSLVALAGDAKIPAKGRPMISPANSPNTIIGRPDDDILMAPGIASAKAVAGTTGGGAVVNMDTTRLEQENRFLRTEMQGLREDMKFYLGMGGSTIRGIGSRVGEAIDNTNNR